jgi:hypothetical protein
MFSRRFYIVEEFSTDLEGVVHLTKKRNEKMSRKNGTKKRYVAFTHVPAETRIFHFYRPRSELRRRGGGAAPFPADGTSIFASSL